VVEALLALIPGFNGWARDSQQLRGWPSAVVSTGCSAGLLLAQGDQAAQGGAKAC